VALAVATARLLPVWQWDSIGYHLPLVNFVIQEHGFAGVPPDLRYITTYPHNIELGMIWLRLMLPDDRLVDLAQVPYGLAGATLTGALARRLGATTTLSALAGAAWLTVPAVFLQLPTNYVDVGTGAALLGAVYFLLLSKVTLRTVGVGALALGLFLGSKPSAPLATAVIGAVAGWRCLQAKHGQAFAALAAVTLLLGAETYGLMLVRHGNPVWPVALRLGPFELPGEYRVDELLASGAMLPRATGGLLERLSVSWLAVTTPPVFDMKLGGLGVLFLVALPFAVMGLIRQRSVLVAAAVVATLLSPDPSIARYVVAFGAITLSLAAASLGDTRWAQRVAVVTVLGVCAWQLGYAWPGLVGDGPAWQAYAGLTDEERRLAVGPHGRPTDYPTLWREVGPTEAAAFDEDFEFPGLVWSPDLRFPVHAVPRQGSREGLARWADERRVRVLAIGPKHRGLVDANPAHWKRLFSCRSVDCAVYVRVDAPWDPREVADVDAVDVAERRSSGVAARKTVSERP